METKRSDVRTEKRRKVEEKAKGTHNTPKKSKEKKERGREATPSLWSLSPLLLTSISSLYSEFLTAYSSFLCMRFVSASRTLFISIQSIRKAWNSPFLLLQTSLSSSLLPSTPLHTHTSGNRLFSISSEAEKDLEDTIHRLNSLLSHSLPLRSLTSRLLRTFLGRKGVFENNGSEREEFGKGDGKEKEADKDHEKEKEESEEKEGAMGGFAHFLFVRSQRLNLERSSLE